MPFVNPGPLITLQNASFGYNRQPVIRNISMAVSHGEFIGLIGPNGAGKSTLFKGMLKLLPPLTGSVIHAPDILRRIGYVPQRDQLDAVYPLTAWDVVRMGIVGAEPWYCWKGTAAIADHIQEALGKVKMTEYQEHPFAELSGGQRQRVLIARALAIHPEMLVLDEPTAGIDPVAEESILMLLSQLNREAGITILMVSHHIQSLQQRVNRVVVVKNEGITVGAAEDLLQPERILQLLGGTL